MTTTRFRKGGDKSHRREQAKAAKQGRKDTYRYNGGRGQSLFGRGGYRG